MAVCVIGIQFTRNRVLTARCSSPIHCVILKTIINLHVHDDCLETLDASSKKRGYVPHQNNLPRQFVGRDVWLSIGLRNQYMTKCRFGDRFLGFLKYQPLKESKLISYLEKRDLKGPVSSNRNRSEEV